jgi:hypothetical protein
MFILTQKICMVQIFPGETLCVLKEKEEKRYSEYRTRDLVLEAWDNMESNHKSNA